MVVWQSVPSSSTLYHPYMSVNMHVHVYMHMSICAPTHVSMNTSIHSNSQQQTANSKQRKKKTTPRKRVPQSSYACLCTCLCACLCTCLHACLYTPVYCRQDDVVEPHVHVIRRLVRERLRELAACRRASHGWRRGPSQRLGHNYSSQGLAPTPSPVCKTFFLSRRFGID